MISLLLFLLGGCLQEDTQASPACSQVANLEIVPLDIWGRDLEGTTLSLDHDPPFVPQADAGPGVRLIRLGREPASLQVILSGPDSFDAAFQVEWSGQDLSATAPVHGRLAFGSDEREVGDQGVRCPVHTVYAGLDHLWFASTGRPWSPNDVTFLQDGEDFWESVAGEFATLRRRLAWSTWWWQSDFELLRPDPLHSTQSERLSRTSMAFFEAAPQVERRLVVNRFWGENSEYTEYINTDLSLLSYAETPGDAFEVVLQDNPTPVPAFGHYEGEAADFEFAARVLENPRYADRRVDVVQGVVLTDDFTVDAASWHQKFMVFDGEVAFVAGMNTKSTDWDTSAHLVYDPARMELSATEEERQEVADGLLETDVGPRKDYGLRIAGPAAHDVEEIFQARWDDALAKGDLYAENATSFALDLPPAQVAGGVPFQVVVTMPDPWNEMSILESHLKAIARAERYIYVEDQYFRAPLLNDAILARMGEEPDLRLIVVTQPMAAEDPGTQYTYLSDQAFRNLYPDRYVLLQLRSVALTTSTGVTTFTSEDINTHSKIRLVDDTYASVGSCNFNNRGYLYEGEMNGVVLDEAFATAARRQVLANLVGERWASRLGEDAADNFDLLIEAAADNETRWAWWSANAGSVPVGDAAAEWASRAPSGFVYPLQITGDYLFDVGPDAF